MEHGTEQHTYMVFSVILCTYTCGSCPWLRSDFLCIQVDPDTSCSVCSNKDFFPGLEPFNPIDNGTDQQSIQGIGTHIFTGKYIEGIYRLYKFSDAL